MRHTEFARRAALSAVALVLLLASAVLPGAAQPPVAAQAACTFAATVADAPLYLAPITTPGQQKDTLPVGVAYPVIARSDAHYYIALDDAYGGWVDRRSGVLSGDCDAVPVDPRPLTDYPTICAVTLAGPVPAYFDASLTQPREDLLAGTYIAVRRAPRAVLVQLGDAMGVWLAQASVSFSGACESLPVEGANRALAGENARVWTQPSVRSGEVMYTLPVGANVLIVAGPVTGPIRNDTSDQGEWVQVVWGPYAPGWVWLPRLTLLDDDDPAAPPVTGSAIAGANTRLWTQPSVRTGSVLAAVSQGAVVRVLAGPVRGPIRYDTDDQDDWYQVAWGDTIGWVWVERITFQ